MLIEVIVVVEDSDVDKSEEFIVYKLEKVCEKG